MTNKLTNSSQKIGLCLLCIYLLQLALGTIIHFFKPSVSFLRGHRPPQNYFHAFFGLAIIALAFYQVHYGITIEWYEGTGDGTVVPRAAMRAWEALLIVCTTFLFLLWRSNHIPSGFPSQPRYATLEPDLLICVCPGLLRALLHRAFIPPEAIQAGSRGASPTHRAGEDLILEPESCDMLRRYCGVFSSSPRPLVMHV